MQCIALYDSVLGEDVGMPRETVTFRIDAETRAALDRLAGVLDP